MSRTHHSRQRSRFGRGPGVAAAISAVALLTAGCVSDDGARPGQDPGTTGELGPDDVVLTASLRTVGSCDALLEELKTEALDRVGPYGFGSGVTHGPVLRGEAVAGEAEDSAGGDAGAPAPATTAPSADAAQADGYSGTTTQEEGVDEPDVVKTDGRRLVVVTASTVRVLDVTGEAPVLERTIQLPEGIHTGELFLDGDRALLLSSGWVERPVPADEAAMTVPPGQPTGQLVELDLAGGNVVRTLEVPGSYLSARAVGDTVRVVVSNGAPQLPFVHPAAPAAAEAAEEANREVVRNSTIEQWLPTYRSLDADGSTTAEGTLVPCEALHLPAEFAGFGTVSVLTVPLSSGLELGETVGVLTDGQTVYASTDRLVVATPEWVDPRIFESGDRARIRELGEDHATALHTFDISDPQRVAYLASGEVEGRVLNQFSLDEHEGMVRVATTEGDMWGQEEDSESFVTILREDGERLVVVGRVGGLGRGEAIQSVRFLDQVAYVVTFRQIDPFYVVDLADPTAPAVTGELKIPGFSSYLHPIGDDLVLGVGQDATEQGEVTGAQVSVFDVSDPANPSRVGQLGLGPETWSLAGQDHRALLWWPPERLAVLPLSQYGWNEVDDRPDNFEGVVVVRVGESGELTEVARLTHPVTEECPGIVEPLPVEPAGDGTTVEGEPAGDGTTVEGEPAGDGTTVEGEPAGVAPPEECYPWQPPVSRSVVVDGVLYTVSDAGVLATGLPDLSPRGFTAFPR